jgi:hypothetical protein
LLPPLGRRRRIGVPWHELDVHAVRDVLEHINKRWLARVVNLLPSHCSDFKHFQCRSFYAGSIAL